MLPIIYIFSFKIYLKFSTQEVALMSSHLSLKGGESFPPWYTQHGLHVHGELSAEEGRGLFTLLALYWLPEGESNILDCWRGKVISRQKPLPGHPQSDPTFVGLPPVSLWSLLPAGESNSVTPSRRRGPSVHSRNFWYWCQEGEQEKESCKAFKKDTYSVGVSLTLKNRQKQEEEKNKMFPQSCTNSPVTSQREKQRQAGGLWRWSNATSSDKVT